MATTVADHARAPAARVLSSGGYPPLGQQLRDGAGRGALLPGGHVPPVPGREHLRPVRNHNGCVWRFEPRTWRRRALHPLQLRQPARPRLRPLGSGLHDRRHGQRELLRPAVQRASRRAPRQAPAATSPSSSSAAGRAAATEILWASSARPRRLPATAYLIANVIGFQWRVPLHDRAGRRPRASARWRPSPIVRQQPTPTSGPWTSRWAPTAPSGLRSTGTTPLIGHMQHHLRDPSRDAQPAAAHLPRHVAPDASPWSTSPSVAGEPVSRPSLRAARSRPRRRGCAPAARIELSGRDTGDVVAAAREWVSASTRTTRARAPPARGAVAAPAAQPHGPRVARAPGSRRRTRARAAATRVLPTTHLRTRSTCCSSRSASA